MKRWFVDGCIAGALLGSLVLNVVLASEEAPSEAGERVIRNARWVNSGPSPRAHCSERSSVRTGRWGNVNGQDEQLHDSFARESRDARWATAQEDVLEAHFQELLSPYRIDLGVECRTRCCEVSGDDVDWALVASEIQTSAGLLGWATEIQFSDHVVACFDRKIIRAAPTKLVRRRNEILAQLRREFDKCGRLSAVATVVSVKLGVNADGSIHSSTREGELSGSEAARCVEKQLVDNARFDRQDEPALVQFVVALTPTEHDSR
jgi:hypothetical protein